MRPDPRVAALFAAPPSEFVARRDALARALAAERSPEAARAGRLRRPPLAAWLLNALARERPEALAAVLEAGDRLRQAQARAVRGEVAALREAGEALHAATADALEAVRAIALAAGHEGSTALLGPVERGLRAAATAAPGERAALRAGVLERLPEAGGLELLGGLAPEAGAGAAPEAERPGRSGAGREQERAAREARAGAERRERERRRARAEAERLERARRRAADRLRRAAQAVERAQAALQAARAAAEAATAAAEAARARAGPTASPALPPRPHRGGGRGGRRSL